MNIDTIRKEIDKRKAANYSYLFLSDRPGDILDKDNCIVHPMHRTWSKNLERDTEKVLEYIASNPEPNYPYRLGFCRKVRGVCDIVLLQGEKPVEIENNEEPIIDNDMIEPVRTFSEALDDRAKIERLEYMVRERDRKISELEEEITDMLSDLQDQEHTQMADTTTNLINQIAPLLPALADKYFAMQERKVAAMENAQRARTQQPPIINEEPTTTIYEDYEIPK